MQRAVVNPARPRRCGDATAGASRLEDDLHWGSDVVAVAAPGGLLFGRAF